MPGAVITDFFLDNPQWPSAVKGPVVVAQLEMYHPGAQQLALYRPSGQEADVYIPGAREAQELD